MTDLRKAAEMALEVMEYNRANGTPNMGAAIEALRQALAQPKREWVGLTKEDMPVGDNPIFDTDEFAFGAAWAQAKLKEKNT